MNNTIYSINGPVVKAANTRDFSMLEMVYVGEKRLIGEVIGVTDKFTTIQVYENTAGLKIGEPIESTGQPVCATLGPGIISNIFDGIERPLRDMTKINGAFVAEGNALFSLDTEKKYDVTVTVKVGEKLKGGDIYCTCPETALITHKCMLPPNVSGEVAFTAENGKYCVNDTIIRLKLADGTEMPLTMVQKWAIKKARPIARRLPINRPLITGQRIIDTIIPIAKGGAAAIPGGFGTGKTMTQHQLAKWCDADIIVYIGCGERGNEMTQVLEEFGELIDPKSNRPLTDRTVLIANTSNMPVAAREASIYTGITLAEYYRDMGYHIAIMADSTSRWAEALREMSGRLEEMPGDEGYPAYLASRLAEFYERAGIVKILGSSDRTGSVTAIGAVSPPGGDLSEPVSQATLRIVKVFWGLSASLAYKRHFPAIDWLISYSLYADKMKDWYSENVSADYAQYRQFVMTTLQEEAALNEIVRLVGMDALSSKDRLTMETAKIIREDYLHQNAFDEVDTYTSMQKQFLMLKIIYEFDTRAREAVENFAPLEDILSSKCKEKIGRAKYIPEENLSEFDEISKLISTEMKALSQGEEDV